MLNFGARRIGIMMGEIRAATAAEVEEMVGWAAAEGWNPGIGDAAAFRVADPDGFLVSTDRRGLAACISAVVYGDTFGFIGFYIVRPDLRGQGHGWRIWQAALARLDGRTTGLDGVVAQQDNYRRSGFVYAHRNVRFAGVPVARAGAPGDASGLHLTPVLPDLVETIVGYDRPLFPADRATFLRSWLSPPRTAMALVGQRGVCGYGVIRRTFDGHKIGPLFADDAAAATLLFDALAATVPGGTVILDPPGTNPAAIALAEERGLRPVFETARMYRGPAPAIDSARIFGITTFELG